MTLPFPGDELSEDARREAFRDELRQTTENGAGRIVGRIPKKVLWGSIAAIVVLGLGGQLVERYFGNLGLPSTSAPSSTLPSPTITLKNRTTTPSVATAVAAFIDFKPIDSAQAPAFALTDQHGQLFGTHQARGRMTLVTFYNKNCNDICPVLGRELKDLMISLGVRASTTNVIIVNTDPFSYSTSSHPAALTQTGLNKYPSVHFVTGTLTSLNAVWANYGVVVKVGANSTEVAHNSIIYFISPTSGLVATARPFAKLNSHGTYSLSSGNIARFAEGLRFETVSLNQ